MEIKTKGRQKTSEKYGIIVLKDLEKRWNG